MIYNLRISKMFFLEKINCQVSFNTVYIFQVDNKQPYSTFQVETEDYNMILTEPQCNFRLNQLDMSEMLFEEYKFQKVIRTNASMLANLKVVIIVAVYNVF